MVSERVVRERGGGGGCRKRGKWGGEGDGGREGDMEKL